MRFKKTPNLHIFKKFSIGVGTAQYSTWVKTVFQRTVSSTEQPDLWKIGHRNFGHNGLFDSHNTAVY